jgi:hypothetical protein
VCNYRTAEGICSRIHRSDNNERSAHPRDPTVAMLLRRPRLSREHSWNSEGENSTGDPSPSRRKKRNSSEAFEAVLAAIANEEEKVTQHFCEPLALQPRAPQGEKSKEAAVVSRRRRDERHSNEEEDLWADVCGTPTLMSPNLQRVMQEFDQLDPGRVDGSAGAHTTRQGNEAPVRLRRGGGAAAGAGQNTVPSDQVSRRRGTAMRRQPS